MRSAIIELEPLSADVSMGLLLYGAQAIRVAFPSRVRHGPRWVTARHDHPANKMCALIDPACCRLEVALPGLVLCHRLARQIHSGHEVRLVSCRPTNNSSSSDGTGHHHRLQDRIQEYKDSTTVPVNVSTRSYYAQICVHHSQADLTERVLVMMFARLTRSQIPARLTHATN